MHTTETTPLARDLMNPHVQTVTPEMSLGDVVSFLLKHKISNAPVVEPDAGKQRLLGFISEGDCLEYLSNEMFYGNPSPPQSAATIMKRHPVCVGPDADVFALTSILVSHRYRHLPVVEDGHLLGIVSRRDILQALEKYYGDMGKVKDRARFPIDLHKIMNLRFLAREQGSM